MVEIYDHPAHVLVREQLEKELEIQSTWVVSFEVRFKSDMFAGFGHDPMDIVKSIEKAIKGHLPHYVKSVEASEHKLDQSND